MSAEEKEKQAKELLYQELLAKKELAALVEKATSVAERIQEIASRLKPEKGTAPFSDLLGEVIEKPGQHDQMTLADCSLLAKKIDTAQERVKALAARVAKL